MKTVVTGACESLMVGMLTGKQQLKYRKNLIQYH